MLRNAFRKKTTLQKFLGKHLAEGARKSYPRPFCLFMGLMNVHRHVYLGKTFIGEVTFGFQELTSVTS